MSVNQRTIHDTVEMDGVGLFSGEVSHLRVSQASPDTGIVFVRGDLTNRPRIEVKPETVHSGFRNTVVANDFAQVDSVEHVLSAAFGLGLDNLEIEVRGKEVPCGDGSSRAFVDMLRRAGVVEQRSAKKEYVIQEPVSVVEGPSSLIGVPNDEGLRISFSIDYEDRLIGRQNISMPINDQTYYNEISPARTFCLKSEADEIVKRGLGGGGNPKNTLVVEDGRVIDNTLRFHDEFVRHKVLDLVGDLAALGGTVRGHIVAVRSGHAENIKFVRKLAALRTDAVEGRKGTEALLDIRELFKILPHRYPMLLIDRVIEMDGYRRAVGIKNVTVNEPFFNGHFPGQPIMPGVLIIEAMAQLAGALLMRKAENMRRLPVLLAIDNAKLRKTVVPGDQLRIETETLRLKSRTGEVFGKALVDGQVAAEALMRFMIIDSGTLEG
jgi:UDP-3-O-[3-hydroxymyristoyl] N-acetylglucosamine deacetylase/3-hydroxyacyl-[acyl-carrier-protein] dehydratase